MVNAITDFRGEFGFLSNFVRCACFGGLSLEHFYQAAKCEDEAEKQQILAAPSPRDAKRLGRVARLRPDWDRVKNDVMLDLLRRKFTPGSPLAEQLLSTGGAELIEGNTWHDNYWGDCSCVRCEERPGQNWLGRLLMTVRDELRAHELREQGRLLAAEVGPDGVFAELYRPLPGHGIAFRAAGIPYDPPAGFAYAKWHRVAAVPALGSEGRACEVWESRYPARFFLVKVAEHPGNEGHTRPAFTLSTGGGDEMERLAALIAKAASAGMLGLNEEA